VREISVSEGNRHFKAIGDFLLDFECIVIRRYFGSERKITIPNTIERLDGGCFCASESISNVLFESGSRLSSIEEFAFCFCPSLSSICIPSSVETFSKYCFSQCESLSTVIFESDSKLSSIGESVFSACPSLSSICIPSSVETLGKFCFCECKSLSTVTFESDSKLASIGASPFYYCSSLSSIYIPSSLHTILGDYRALLMAPRVPDVPKGDAVVLAGDCVELDTVNRWRKE
jgi:hypothetical protein